MRSYILTLLLVTMLALPITVVMSPVQASPQQQEQTAPALAAKKKDKKKAKPKFKTVTRTVRQPLTQSFSNAAGIAINDDTKASPYPSALNASGLANGVITDVNLTLNGFTHEVSDDADVLVTKGSTNLVVLSDAGGNQPAAALSLTFDDAAAAQLPDATALISSTFLPTNHVSQGADTFPAPAPTASTNTLLAAFNGIDPNGEWQLFISDDAGAFAGSIASWSLLITAEVDVQVQEQIKAKKDKKKGKGGKKGKQ